MKKIAIVFLPSLATTGANAVAKEAQATMVFEGYVTWIRQLTLWLSPVSVVVTWTRVL